MEIVVPSMGTSFCLVRIPTSVAILFLLGRASVVVLVPNACHCLLRRRLLDLGRFLRRCGFGGVPSGKVLTAIAPKAWPRLASGLASGFHIIPLLAARFHCRRLRRRDGKGYEAKKSKTWQRLKSERSRFSFDSSWMAVGAIKMAARLGRASLPSSSAHDGTKSTLPHYALERHRG